ncbi:MAG TPA: VTT domain-containing protein [Anaerolineales bacterium]|nr:VTT domain-containing protein [Anaerolineales bacterium]HMV95696.1 VTT domain-containing protein [Anaerolineales bacterium]HMX17674.1 VTT domain-containing protein [Anaerolineales bacterium]HMX73078.1 VTT domain-containing protein [Anaerolineales bacterium]HMZ43295.1 VTT domain-containing protein [Anaerolineales bacterium]
MSDFFLTQVINFGTPLVGLILFLGALGFPVGASVVVIAAGAFGQQGILDIPSAAIYGLLGAVIGDTLSFGMGYYAKDAVQRRFGNSAAWQGATETFQKNAGMAVFLTRWLITAIAIPTNLIAGGSGYKYSRFISYDLTGEIVWIILYGGLGYLFGSQWELVYDFMSNFGGLILGIVLMGFGIRQALQWQKNSRDKINQKAEA